MSTGLFRSRHSTKLEGLADSGDDLGDLAMRTVNRVWMSSTACTWEARTVGASPLSPRGLEACRTGRFIAYRNTVASGRHLVA